MNSSSGKVALEHKTSFFAAGGSTSHNLMSTEVFSSLASSKSNHHLSTLLNT